MRVKCTSDDCTVEYFSATMTHCPVCGAPASEPIPAEKDSLFNFTRGIIAFLILACPAWYWVFTARTTQSVVVACLVTLIVVALSLKSVSLKNVAVGTAATFVSHNLGKKAGRRVFEKLDDQDDN